MSTSYKTLWQEAQQQLQKQADEIALLNTKLERATRESQEKIDRLHSFIVANRSDLAKTRPVVDLAGIARHMGVGRLTPQQWAQRKLLPPVDFPEIREPLWYAATVREKFAVPTGRVWYDVPPDEELSPAA